MKKLFKSALAVLLALTMLFTFASAAFAAEDLTSQSDIQLRFNKDGKFRILQIADSQDDTFCAPGTIACLKKSIAKYQPDLVVFTGDNHGAATTSIDSKLALKAILTCCEEAAVPFTAVFGNHDAENVAKETIMGFYRDYKMCMMYDADPEMYGAGTHNLTVLSSDGERTAYNLWMFDSNMYDPDGGYDYVHEDQVAWYVKTSNELKAANDGNVVPSLCFQHIIPNEIYDYVIEVPEATAEGYSRDGKNYALNPQFTQPGSVMLEAPCPPSKNGTQFRTFAQQGDVVGVVLGHDHVNDFVVHTTSLNAGGTSIDLIQTPGFTFQSYGDERVRGCRIIDLDESKPWEYESFTPTFFEVMGDTQETRTLSYISENYGWYVVSEVLRAIPVIGTLLSQLFLKYLYELAIK